MGALDDLRELLVLVDPRTDRPFECRGCGASYDVEHYVCPECGGFSVERRYDGPPEDRRC